MGQITASRARIAVLGATAVLCFTVMPVAVERPAADSTELGATTSASTKKSVKKLKKGLKKLARRLDELEREPGPTGPSGPQGERGPQGPGGLATGAAGGDLAGSYPDPAIAEGAVTTPKLANDSVVSAKVLNGSLALGDLASNSVNSAKVANDSLTGTDVDESSLAGLWRVGGNSGVGAGDFVGTTDNSPLNFRVNNARALRLEPGFNGGAAGPSLVGGSPDNSVTPGAHSATIGGGGRAASDNPDTANRVTDSFGTVGGGGGNQAGDDAGTTGGRSFATVGGGGSNISSGFGATVVGGVFNVASGESATVEGGFDNAADGQAATVGGGTGGIAAGDYSFVAGRRARNTTLSHDGVFLFADSTDADFNSSAADEFAVRASGGFRFRTSSSLATGCNLPAGSGTFSCTSDERTKRDFEAVDPREVLGGVARLPVRTWRFESEAPPVRHLGPTAQDFHRAFGLGSDETSIGLPDANGVALAAIKGLNTKLRAERRRRIVQERRVDRLQDRLAAVERGSR
jgi:hypothetical protein